MGLFKEAENTTAFAKVGILGFAGSGKTRTATEIAIGLHKALKSNKPVTFLDTETGSDFTIPFFKKEGIQLLVSKTRAFKDLAEGMLEAPKISDILIIDSVSHFWVDIVESYCKKKNVNRLAFQDWGIIKPMWRDDFATPFVSLPIHIIVCGRAGFEYDYFEGEDGKMELYKTGTKMNTEKEFGFEPSLLIEMERIKNPEATEHYKSAKTKDQKLKASKEIMEAREFVRVATVLKDRSDIMDGIVLTNPTYKDFAPHWQSINIGGVHHPLEAGDSTDLFDKEGKPDWMIKKQQATITLEEIEGQLTKYFPGTSAKEKKAKLDLIDEVFKTRSWTKVQSLKLEELKDGLKNFKAILDLPENIKVLMGEQEGKIIVPTPPDIVVDGEKAPETGKDTSQKGSSLSDIISCPKGGEFARLFCESECPENFECEAWKV
jgi:hypothetical protein